MPMGPRDFRQEWQIVTLSAAVKKITFKHKFISKPYVMANMVSTTTLVSRGWLLSGLSSNQTYLKTNNNTSATFHVQIAGRAWPGAYPIL